MRVLILVTVAACVVAHTACAQTTVLYEQNWGDGNGSPGLVEVGWSQVLPPSNAYSGTYQEAAAHDGDTAAPLPANTLYFGGQPGLGVFYTTNGAGGGTLGNSAFVSIDPTAHTNLNLSVECQWSWNGENLTCWFAVEVGGAWYVNTNEPLTTAQHSPGSTFHRSGITYDPAASNWNTLTVSPAVSIGGAAPANLSGNITGIGIVVQVSGAEASWNYNLLQVTSISNLVDVPPTLAAGPISQVAYEGAGVSFAVKANGSEPFTYTWMKDGLPLPSDSRISGADSALLTIRDVNAGDIGLYSVLVSNSSGAFDTSTNELVSLNVEPVPTDNLYAETFPFVGALTVGYPLSVVGWSNAISDNLNRLYQAGGGDGAAFAFEGSASTRAFYVTTNSDPGTSGLPFEKITPGSHPAVSFSVDIAPSFQPANVTACFAVQMSSGNWYVSSTPIPVDTSTATTAFTTYAQQFDPLAEQWNTLTLNATSATIGGPAPANLTGDIIGAGLVFVYAGSGNFNVDNFRVTTTPVAPMPPMITFSPFGQTVYTGAGVSFAVNAVGTRPFTYYWQKDGSTLSNGGRISGAGSNILTIVDVNSGNAGNYSVIVSNSAGTDWSAFYVTTDLVVNDRPADLVYEEKFPYVGPGTAGYPLSVVGWANAIPNSPDRLFQIVSGEGAAFAFQGSAATTALFTSTGLEDGTSGLPFPNDIAVGSTLDLTFSVDIAPTFAPANVSAAIALQMNGGPWYVSASNLPVDTSFENPEYATYTQVFDPGAANWKNLTLVAGSGAVVGSTLAAPLTGTITGAGLVFVHTGSGTFNIDNFRITGTVIGALTVTSVTPSTISLSWNGQPGIKLQSTTSLAPPAIWADVPGTDGQSGATVNRAGPVMFFRLSN